MKFDHSEFFNSYRNSFGSLTQSKVDGLESLLNALESDPEVNDERWAAYMFATVKHECADTWEPIEEFGKGKGRKYGNPVTVKGSDGGQHTNVYYGRGYVQLTWKNNYESMSEKLDMGDTLLIHPEKALEPDIAYRIMSCGMRNGTFTTKKLDNYINSAKCDYTNARRIINALDQAAKIAGYAQKLENCFKSSRIADN